FTNLTPTTCESQPMLERRRPSCHAQAERPPNRFLRRKTTLSSPAASSGKEVGSGTGVPGVPGTRSAPSVVPNEKVALSTGVPAVTPVMSRRNVADPLRNGLCGPLPAIEPLALLYTLLPSGGPMIKWLGAVGDPRTSS